VPRWTSRSAAWCVAIAGSAALALLMAVATPAEAHQSSVTHDTATLRADGTSVDYRILISPPDLAETMGLAAGTDPDDATVAARREAIAAHVTAAITIESDGAPCPPLAPAVAVVQDGGRWVEVRWRAHCQAPIERLAIDYDLFFDVDPLHTAFLVVEDGRGAPISTVLEEGSSRFVWDLAAERPSGLLAYVRAGIEHILTGFDHIAFLIGLLLVIGIERDERGRWRARRLRPALHATAVVVTSFTVAHSITLIAAALGWVALPSRIVESAIAISIVFVAVQDIVRPEARRRYLVTFTFGLMHGLGFARMLAVMLPPDGVLPPLLLFNLGVELGQLAIVAVVLPILHLAVRRLGPERYRAQLLPVLGAVLAVLGALWLIERVAGVVLLGF
jgi:HupE/UreJ protein